MYFFNFEDIIVIILVCSKWYVTYLRKNSTISKFFEKNCKLISQFKFQGWEIGSVSAVSIFSVQGKAILAARFSNPNPSAAGLGVDMG